MGILNLTRSKRTRKDKKKRNAYVGYFLFFTKKNYLKKQSYISLLNRKQLKTNRGINENTFYQFFNLIVI